MTSRTFTILVVTWMLQFVLTVWVLTEWRCP
jgi:hypothetical protein